MYLGKQIWRRLNKYSEWAVGKVCVNTLRENVQKIIAPYGAKVRILQQKVVSKRIWFMIGGEFDPCSYHKPITIDVLIREDRGYIYFTEKRKQRFLFLLHQTLQHELVHKLQFRNRGSDNFYTHHYYFTPGSSKSSPKKMEYLAMVEEIDAYAHDLALEIKYLYPNDDPKAILKRISEYSDLDTWKMYSKTFKRARWVHVRNELLRKTYKWLPTVKESF